MTHGQPHDHTPATSETHDHAASAPSHEHDHHGHSHSHEHGAPAHGGHSHDDSTGMAEIFALEAEAFAETLSAIVASIPVTDDPHHILDLGAGPGAGTFALLGRFPQAHVTAVDTSADNLAQLRATAAERGVDDRITTIEADLDETAWPDLGFEEFGVPDLVWASASMHHMSDPADVLHRVHDFLAPEGTFALLELAGQPYFLPEDAPTERPGLEIRLHEEVARLHREHMPHMGGDWTPMLTGADFTITEARTLPIRIDDPDRSEQITRYATRILPRMRSMTADRLDAEDLAALDHLLDATNPQGLVHRTDLAIRTERDLWVCRKA